MSDRISSSPPPQKDGGLLRGGRLQRQLRREEKDGRDEWCGSVAQYKGIPSVRVGTSEESSTDSLLSLPVDCIGNWRRLLMTVTTRHRRGRNIIASVRHVPRRSEPSRQTAFKTISLRFNSVIRSPVFLPPPPPPLCPCPCAE